MRGYAIGGVGFSLFVDLISLCEVFLPLHCKGTNLFTDIQINIYFTNRAYTP